MQIFISKFGRVLTSRQSGKEAYEAFTPTLDRIPDGEEVIVDFENVNTLTPSWADEFLTPLEQRFGKRLRCLPSDNPSVVLTLQTLEKANGIIFTIV